jgi:hypothetical protein
VKHNIHDHIIRIRKQKDRDRERTRERRKVAASSRSIWKNNQAKKHIYKEKMKEREGGWEGRKKTQKFKSHHDSSKGKKADTMMQKDL